MPSGGSGSPFFQLSSGYQPTESTVTIDQDSLMMCEGRFFWSSLTSIHQTVSFSINGIKSYARALDTSDFELWNSMLNYFDVTNILDESGTGSTERIFYFRYFLKSGDVVVFDQDEYLQYVSIFPIIYTGSHQTTNNKWYTDTFFDPWVNYDDPYAALPSATVSFDVDICYFDQIDKSLGVGKHSIHNVPYQLADNRFSIEYNDQIKTLPRGGFMWTDERCPGIVPQSDPIPGVYYFKSYDLSSIVEGDIGDVSTDDYATYDGELVKPHKIVIPPEFSDYISVDLSVMVSLGVTADSARRVGCLYDILNEGNYKDKDGYDTYIEIYPQVVARLDSPRYDTICSREQLRELNRGDSVGLVVGSENWYRLNVSENIRDVNLTKQNIKITFAYLKINGF